MSGRREDKTFPRSPLTGGRRREPQSSGRRFVLALAFLLGLCALGLWFVDRAAGHRDAPARVAAAPARPVDPRARAFAVVRAEFGTGTLGACMFSVAGRETGYTYDPRATNWADRHSDGSRGSFGLFQIGAVHRSPGETVSAFRRRMLDPAANAALAHRLERGAGLQPWGGYC